jgi:hypothetical protein
VPPGSAFVVIGVANETAGQDADETSSDVTERGVMGIAGGSPVVVEGTSSACTSEAAPGEPRASSMATSSRPTSAGFRFASHLGLQGGVPGLVAADGGILAFGNAGFYGSTGSLRLNKPMVGMSSTPSGGGYWLVAGDGGILSL